jgi:hypothetical protein
VESYKVESKKEFAKANSFLSLRGVLDEAISLLGHPEFISGSALIP